MLWTRFKTVKNKRAMTLVEMIVAIAVTAILAVCLSMVMSPVIKTYGVNKARAEMAVYADAVLNHMANDFRTATNILVTSDKDGNPNACSLPDPEFIFNNYSYVYVCYAYCNWHEYENTNEYYVSKATYCIDFSKTYKYVYPAHYNVTEAEGWEGVYYSAYLQSLNLKFKSMLKDKNGKEVDHWYWIQCENAATATGGIQVDGDKGFYILIKNNPDTLDGQQHGQIIDIHLKLKKGKIKHEATKSVVCENMVLNNTGVQKANKNGLYVSDPAKVSTSDDIKNTNACFPYYSIWFGIGLQNEMV